MREQWSRWGTDAAEEGTGWRVAAGVLAVSSGFAALVLLYVGTVEGVDLLAAAAGGQVLDRSIAPSLTRIALALPVGILGAVVSRYWFAFLATPPPDPVDPYEHFVAGVRPDPSTLRPGGWAVLMSLAWMAVAAAVVWTAPPLG